MGDHMPEHDELEELLSLLALDSLPALAEPPPADLRDQVLAAALGRRPAGRPTTSPGDLSPVDAFARSIEDLHALLASLGPAEAELHAHEDHGRVRDLIAHLVAVERLCQRWMDPADEVPFLPDHVAATRATVAALAVLPYNEVFDLWHEAALAALAAARRCPADHGFRIHDIPGNVDVLMSLRTFELWAHAMDVAVATDRPLPTPDDERMLLMSNRLMRGVPGALLYRGVAVPGRTARFVLTGPAGGCYDVTLDGRPASLDDGPDVTIVGEALHLCQIGAGRLRPDEAAVLVEGDQELAALVLANIDAFARD